MAEQIARRQAAAEAAEEDAEDVEEFELVEKLQQLGINAGAAPGRGTCAACLGSSLAGRPRAALGAVAAATVASKHGCASCQTSQPAAQP